MGYYTDYAITADNGTQAEVTIYDYPEAPESSPPAMVLFGKDKRDDTKYSFE